MKIKTNLFWCICICASVIYCQEDTSLSTQSITVFPVVTLYETTTDTLSSDGFLIESSDASSSTSLPESTTSQTTTTVTSTLTSLSTSLPVRDDLMEKKMTLPPTNESLRLGNNRQSTDEDTPPHLLHTQQRLPPEKTPPGADLEDFGTGDQTEEKKDSRDLHSEHQPEKAFDYELLQWQNGDQELDIPNGFPPKVREVLGCVGEDVSLAMEIPEEAMPRNPNVQYLIVAKGNSSTNTATSLGSIFITDLLQTGGSYRNRITFLGSVRRGQVKFTLHEVTKGDSGLYALAKLDGDKSVHMLRGVHILPETALLLHVYDPPLPKPMRLVVETKGNQATCSGAFHLGDAELVMKVVVGREYTELGRVGAPNTTVTGSLAGLRGHTLVCVLDGPASHCNHVPSTGHISAEAFTSSTQGPPRGSPSLLLAAVLWLWSGVA